MRVASLFLIVCCLSFFNAQRAFAQDQVVQVLIKLGGESIQYKDSIAVDTTLVYSDFRAKVFIGDSLISIDTTDVTGKIYSIKLQINQLYTIQFEKDGYVSKITEISTFFPAEKISSLPPVTFTSMEVILFEFDPDCDFSFLETTPMAKFYLGEGTGFMEYDKAYIKEMLMRVEKIRRGIVD